MHMIEPSICSKVSGALLEAFQCGLGTSCVLLCLSSIGREDSRNRLVANFEKLAWESTGSICASSFSSGEQTSRPVLPGQSAADAELHRCLRSIGIPYSGPNLAATSAPPICIAHTFLVVPRITTNSMRSRFRHIAGRARGPLRHVESCRGVRES